MLYTAYELNRRAGAPVVAASELTARALHALPAPLAAAPASATAGGLRHPRARAADPRPPGVRHRARRRSTAGRSRSCERPVTTTPFATLLHFEKPVGPGQPRVLARRAHVRALHDADPARRSAPCSPTTTCTSSTGTTRATSRSSTGAFGLDEYIEHVMEALRDLGPDTHVVAVCQPAVPVLAAVALLAAADDPAQPASMTLMAGPDRHPGEPEPGQRPRPRPSRCPSSSAGSSTRCPRGTPAPAGGSTRGSSS